MSPVPSPPLFFTSPFGCCLPPSPLRGAAVPFNFLVVLLSPTHPFECCFFLPSLLLLGGAAFTLCACGLCCFPNLLSGGTWFSASFVVLPSPSPLSRCCFLFIFLLGGGALTLRSFWVVLPGLLLHLWAALPSSTTFGWCCRSPFFGMK